MNNILVVNGGKQLSGEIKIQGAKNSVLPILAATVINGGKNVIHNCPIIKDVSASFDILKELGCTVTVDGNDAVIDSSDIRCGEINEKLMREMRSSVIFTGAVLARCKNAVISMPGGCELGPRPIDLHLKAFKTLGVRIEEMNGYIYCDGEGLHCDDVFLDFPSVGATENIMLLACGIKGVTKIYNAAREPEIIDLQGFLNSIGANISGAGTGTITINGADDFCDCEYCVMGDRIVASTYLVGAAVTGGSLTVTDVLPETVKPVISVLEQCGAYVNSGDNYIKLAAPKRLKAVSCVSTMPHPGFPTDAQAIITTLLSVAVGTSVIEENIFLGRFKHISELNRMGADIIVKDKIAVVRGVGRLKGACVTACDLRGAAALVLAGLNAKGTTTISGLEHLDRGYESFEKNLKMLGADIARI